MVDLETTSLRELNQRLHDADSGRWRVVNPGGRHAIAAGIDAPLEVTIGNAVRRREDVKRWEEAGVDRIIVSPWARSREALDGLHRFAADILA